MLVYILTWLDCIIGVKALSVVVLLYLGGDVCL